MEKEELIIDTSSILFGLSNNRNIFDILKETGEYDVLISKGVLLELKRFSSSKTQLKSYAAIALLSIKKHNLKIDSSSGYVDDWIVRRAKKDHCIVCTNDIKLKKRLHEIGINVLSITNSGILK